jgi:hypothetical protein
MVDSPDELDDIYSKAREVSTPSVPASGDDLDSIYAAARATPQPGANQNTTPAAYETGSAKTAPISFTDAINELKNRMGILGKGMLQGINTVGQHLSFFNSDAENKAQAETNADYLKYKNGLPSNYQKIAGAGEIGGQIAASTPLLMTGGAALEGLQATGAAIPAIQAGLKSVPTAGKVALSALSASGNAVATNTGFNALTGRPLGSNNAMAALIGPPARFLGNALSGQLGGESAEDATAASASDKVSQALERQGLDPELAQNKLITMGDRGNVADLGPNTLGLTRAAYATPGEGKDIITQALNERQATSSAVLRQKLANNLGAVPTNTKAGLMFDYDTPAQQLIKEDAEGVAPLYDAAYKANQNVMTPKIDRILSTPFGQSSLKKAATLMQNDMTNVAVNDPELVEQAKLAQTYEPGTGGIASGLKLRTLDYVKQAMDSEVQKAMNNGDANLARILGNRTRDLVEELDNADVTAAAGPNSTVPEGGLYAQARAAAQNNIQNKAAYEAGQNYVNNGAAENVQQISNLTPKQQKLFSLGAGKSTDQQLFSANYSDNAAKRIYGSEEGLVGSPAKRANLQAIFPDDAAFNDFAKTASQEAHQYNTRRAIMNQSQTANIAKELEDVSQSGIGNKLLGVGKTAANVWAAGHGYWEPLAAQSVSKLFTKAAATPMSEEEAAIIARTMMGRNINPLIGEKIANQSTPYINRLIQSVLPSLGASSATGTAQP